MRIGGDYFRRLLYETNALEAVFDLDQLWCSREGVDEAKPYFGLTQVECNVHLFLLYQGEVGNGGHFQFFSNPSAAYCSEIAQALETMNLSDVSQVFAQACAVFPDSIVPRDNKTRQLYIATLAESALQRWNELTRAFYKVDTAAWPVVLDYIRANEAHVLVPERG